MAQALSEPELLALVDRLADGAWHSGEALAAQSGISRAALAKRIDRLGEWQLAIEARHGLGYRLTQPLQRLDEHVLQSALGSKLRVRVVPVTDSTSAQLMTAPAADDPQALLAEFQTAGRGRRGRQWVSPFGAQLALSLAWSFDEMPPQLTALPLAVGVACVRALRAQGAQDVGLKWPNDIVVAAQSLTTPPASAGGPPLSRGERGGGAAFGGVQKLGGILLEHRGEGGGACRVVVGVGINLSLQPQQAGAVTQPWVNLDALLPEPAARNTLAADLLRELYALLAGYGEQGFAPLAAQWSALDVTRDHPVRVLLGERTLDGIARGINAQGALIVEADGERHPLHSGEVSLRLRA